MAFLEFKSNFSIDFILRINPMVLLVFPGLRRQNHGKIIEVRLVGKRRTKREQCQEYSGKFFYILLYQKVDLTYNCVKQTALKKSFSLNTNFFSKKCKVIKVKM
jgi:hypothetical protein